MKWIKDNTRPDIIEKIDDWGKSKKVLILINDVEPVVGEYNKGIQDGDDWEQWYCSVYEDVVEDVTGWCDCIPEIKKL